MEVGKGFVYTLEAFIAATLFLTMVTVVIPQVTPENSMETIDDTLMSSLTALEKTGELEDNLTVGELEEDLEPFIPSDYNYTARINKLETDVASTNSPSQHYINLNGSYSEVQLYISSVNSLNATFNGLKILKNRNQEGYVRRDLNAAEGWLNFTGTAELSYSVNSYREVGESVEATDVKSVNFVSAGENLSEITVVVWQ